MGLLDVDVGYNLLFKNCCFKLATLVEDFMIDAEEPVDAKNGVFALLFLLCYSMSLF
jgi:hypothetical protein